MSIATITVKLGRFGFATLTVEEGAGPDHLFVHCGGGASYITTVGGGALAGRRGVGEVACSGPPGRETFTVDGYGVDLIDKELDKHMRAALAYARAFSPKLAVDQINWTGQPPRELSADERGELVEEVTNAVGPMLATHSAEELIWAMEVVLNDMKETP